MIVWVYDGLLPFRNSWCQFAWLFHRTRFTEDGRAMAYARVTRIPLLTQLKNLLLYYILSPQARSKVLYLLLLPASGIPVPSLAPTSLNPSCAYLYTKSSLLLVISARGVWRRRKVPPLHTPDTTEIIAGGGIPKIPKIRKEKVRKRRRLAIGRSFMT